MVTAAIILKDALLLGSKAIINLDGVLKRRNITLLTKVHIVKAIFFPTVMYRHESWTLKKAAAAAAAKLLQSCPTLSNPMDCSPPGSSEH